MTGSGPDPVKAGFIESFARPGGNVTGLTYLSTELGGKRLELLKEALTKLTHVAVLYDRDTPGTAREVKEDLPVAARALGLTVRSWEIRDADGLERAFAALNKGRPDGLYVPLTGALMRANGKRIAGFALKNRLPSLYGDKDGVDVGGLMYYGADLADIYRRVATYVDKILKGAKPAGLPVERPTKFEPGYQSDDGEADRCDDSTECAGAGGQRHQVILDFRLPILRLGSGRGSIKGEKHH